MRLVELQIAARYRNELGTGSTTAKTKRKRFPTDTPYEEVLEEASSERVRSFMMFRVNDGASEHKLVLFLCTNCTLKHAFRLSYATISGSYHYTSRALTGKFGLLSRREKSLRVEA